ncbi:MAG TPA: universal stress protein [Methanoregula sp.]|nr:universal stress protein [Methanoregula sp.]
MAELKRILVALDMRNGMQNLIEAAAFMAHAFRSEIILYHAIPKTKGSPIKEPVLKESVEQILEQTRGALIEQVPEVRIVTDFGSPVEQILEAAEGYGVDLIAIGSGSKEPQDRFQLGITAEQIIRYSPRPVWVVKSRQKTEVERILCPVDFSDPSRRALDFALVLAGVLDAELTVLTVIEKLSNIYPNFPVVKPHEQGTYAEDRAAEFEDFLKDVDFGDVRWKRVMLQGEPHEEILRFIHEKECRLIVMGSEGRTGVGRLILGSVAEKVVREVPCSVITVKAGAAGAG